MPKPNKPEADPPGQSRRDVEDVLREERSRGRRPVDTDEQHRQAEQKAAIRKIYREGNEDQLRQVLRLWKYSDQEIEQFVEKFRELRASETCE